MTRLGWILAVLLPLLDEVDKAKSELGDRSYGNYWDRLDACRDLGRIANVRAAEILVGILDDPEMPIREAAVLALAKMQLPEVRKWLVDIYPKLAQDVKRANLLWSFREAKDKAAVPLAVGALKDNSPIVREEAARFLGDWGDASAAEPLEKVLKDSADAAREQILFAYAKRKGADGASKLEEQLSDAHPRIRAAALLALARIGKAAPHLAQAAKDKTPEPRIAAAEASMTAGTESILETATVLLPDKDWRVRAATVEALEEAWDKRAVELLVGRFAQEDGRLRLDIALALQRMTGKDLGFDAKAWKAWWDASREAFQMAPKPAKKGKGKNGIPVGDTRATFFNIPILSKRLTFVIDFSGSMKTEDEIYKNKRKIDVAFEELEKALGAMEAGAKANVVILSTEATVQKKRVVSPTLVDVANRKKIMDFVKATWQVLDKTKRGRGDIYDAILDGWEDPEVDTIILLSDGKATYGKYLDRDDLVGSVGEIHRYRRVAVHTVLIGSKGIDRETMERIAEATRAIYTDRK